jgi:hypothetical protein
LGWADMNAYTNVDTLRPTFAITAGPTSTNFTGYDIEFRYDSNFGDTPTNLPQSTTFATTASYSIYFTPNADFTEFKTLYYRIRGRNNTIYSPGKWSNVYTKYISRTRQLPQTLIYPPNGATQVVSPVRLSWTEAPLPSTVNYVTFTIYSPNGTTLVKNDISASKYSYLDLIFPNSIVVPPPLRGWQNTIMLDIPSGSRVEWKVRVLDSAKAYTSFSNTSSFTVK